MALGMGITWRTLKLIDLSHRMNSSPAMRWITPVGARAPVSGRVEPTTMGSPVGLAGPVGEVTPPAPGVWVSSAPPQAAARTAMTAAHAKKRNLPKRGEIIATILLPSCATVPATREYSAALASAQHVAFA